MSDGQVEVTAGNRRLVQKRAARPNAFSAKKQRAFFEALAECANVRMSAERAGVSYGAVYQWRRKNLEFRMRWDEALDHGYASLEAGLLEQAREAAGEIPVRAKPDARVGPMDARLAFALLQHRDRNRGSAPGDHARRKGDVDAVLDRLEKALKRYAPTKAEPKPEGPGA